MSGVATSITLTPQTHPTVLGWMCPKECRIQHNSQQTHLLIIDGLSTLRVLKQFLVRKKEHKIHN